MMGHDMEEVERTALDGKVAEEENYCNDMMIHNMMGHDMEEVERTALLDNETYLGRHLDVDCPMLRKTL